MGPFSAPRHVRTTTKFAVLWMFFQAACGARSPLLGGEEELGGEDGVSSLPSGGAPSPPSGGGTPAGGLSPSGSGGRDDAPEDGGRGFLGSGGEFGARPLLCDPSAESPCKNGGECVPSAGDTHQCLCPPGTFGEHCDFYIVQATPHCLLGSDGYMRDCRHDFVGVQAEFGRFKRITTYYQSGANKGEPMFFYLAALEPLGYPRLFRDGTLQNFPYSTFQDILLSRFSLWLLTTDGNLAVTNLWTPQSQEDMVTTPSRVTQLGANDTMACGLNADHVLECWQSMANTVGRLPRPLSEKLASFSRSGDAGLTETGELRCVDQAACSQLKKFGPFVQVESGCALNIEGDVYCLDGSSFPGPFDWFVLQGLESPTRFCGSRRETHELVCMTLMDKRPALPPPMQALDVTINDVCVWVIDGAGDLHCFPRHDDWRRAVSLSSLPGRFDKLFGGERVCARRRVPAERLECWGREDPQAELRTGYVDQIHTQSGTTLKDGFPKYPGAPIGDEKIARSHPARTSALSLKRGHSDATSVTPPTHVRDITRPASSCSEISSTFRAAPTSTALLIATRPCIAGARMRRRCALLPGSFSRSPAPRRPAAE